MCCTFNSRAKCHIAKMVIKSNFLMMQIFLTHWCVIQQLRVFVCVFVVQLCGNYRNHLQLCMQAKKGILPSLTQKFECKEACLKTSSHHLNSCCNSNRSMHSLTLISPYVLKRHAAIKRVTFLTSHWNRSLSDVQSLRQITVSQFHIQYLQGLHQFLQVYHLEKQHCH